MRSKICFIFLTVSIFYFNPQDGLSQHPERFRKEIDSIVIANTPSSTHDVIVFTGSSSIRFWKNLKSDFPRHNVVNMGFGGSNMKDLLFYTQDVILNFRPVQVFIYEGDNDIGSGHTPSQILGSADSILLMIRQSLPAAEVVFISPKPSIRRWHLKNEYEVFNSELKRWVNKQQNVKFADVWTSMLDKTGTVQQDIFVEDGLHLNEKGYAIWKSVLTKFLP